MAFKVTMKGEVVKKAQGRSFRGAPTKTALNNGAPARGMF